MKKKTAGAVLAAVMVLGVFQLGGCGSRTGETETAAETDNAEDKTAAAETAEDGNKTSEKADGIHTVTFYDSDGTTVLETAEVEDGALVEEPTPQKDGYIFAGWYATPQMSHKFDFSKAVTEDISVFGGFVSYVEDTRSFYIVGSGKSPVLLESNWGAVTGEAQTLKKEETEETNLYTITLDLQAGDEFQFAIDSSWGDQRGYGYLTTIEQDGVEYFENSGGLGDTSVKKANIKVAVAGNYTFTLTTFPAEDTYDTEDSYYSEDKKENFNYNAYDTITWSYNGEAAADGAEYQTDYYIKGKTITGWEDVYTEETKFTEDNGVYTLTIELEEGDEFLFTTLITSGDTESAGNEYVRFTNISSDDSQSLSYVTGTENANIVALSGGTYTFTYDAATQALTVDFQ